MHSSLQKHRYTKSLPAHTTHILTISIVFIVLISNISITYASSIPTFSERLKEYNYIIELEEKNGIQTFLEAQENRGLLLNKLKHSQIMYQITHNITIMQQNVKENIRSLFKDRKLQFTTHYNLILNAIVLNGINTQMASAIEKLPQVKKITRDKEIKVNDFSTFSPTPSSKVNESKINQNFNITDNSTTIAFFDTGVDYTHPALNKHYLGGYDFVNNDSNPMDDHGHGTHCTGIAVGNETRSSYDSFDGVAPDTPYYSYKVLNEEGVGYTSAFLQAFEQAMDPNNDGDFSDHVDIISISAGDPEGDSDDPLSQAAQNVVSAGIIVVSAAGNQGPEQNTISSPALAKEVIAVGASSAENLIAPFSSRGSTSFSTVKPDVVAPGVSIKSTWLQHDYETLSGSSMACPYVAGYCALLLHQNPTWSPYEIKMALRANAEDVGYNLTTQGYGKISLSTNITTGPFPNASLKPLIPIEKTTVEINGTANGKDLWYYTLSYQLISSIDTHQYPWTTIYNGTQPITNNTIYTWNTHNLPAGQYKINLSVHSRNQTSKDIIFVSITEEKHQVHRSVFTPDTIQQKEHFTATLYSSLHHQEKALFLFFSPFRIPQIRIGSTVSFQAPSFYSEDKTIQSKLFIIPFEHRPLEIISKQIIISS